MSAAPLACSEVAPQLADLLDELLDPAEAARLEAHLEGCAECGAVRTQQAQQKALLESPWEVAPLHAGVARALRERLATTAGGSGRRRARTWLGHGAAFAAGVLVTLAWAATAANGAELQPSAPVPGVAAPPASGPPFVAPGPHPVLQPGLEPNFDVFAYSPRRIR